MILLPLTLAAVTAGCSTFSDSDVVARVNDVELTNDEFDARLTELGVTDTDVVQLEPVRAELTRWIQQQLVPDDEIAATYNAGPADAGAVCTGVIVVADEASADATLAALEAGTAFADVFQSDNLDPSLTATNGIIRCLLQEDLVTGAGTPFIDAVATLSAEEPYRAVPVLDDAGQEAAWVVVRFRPWAELESAESGQVVGLVDVTEVAGDADVYVASRYGTFDAETGTVVSLG
jgi:hypothetical protein